MADKPSCKERWFRTKKGRYDNDNNDNNNNNSLRQNIFQTKKPLWKCKRQEWCSRGGQGREHIQALSRWLCATPVSFRWGSRDDAPIRATKRHRATAHKEERLSGGVSCLLDCAGPCQHQPRSGHPQGQGCVGSPCPQQKVNPLSEMGPSISSHCHQQGTWPVCIQPAEISWVSPSLEEGILPVPLYSGARGWQWGSPGDKARMGHDRGGAMPGSLGALHRAGSQQMAFLGFPQSGKQLPRERNQANPLLKPQGRLPRGGEAAPKFWNILQVKEFKNAVCWPQ